MFNHKYDKTKASLIGICLCGKCAIKCVYSCYLGTKPATLTTISDKERHRSTNSHQHNLTKFMIKCFLSGNF